MGIVSHICSALSHLTRVLPEKVSASVQFSEFVCQNFNSNLLLLL